MSDKRKSSTGMMLFDAETSMKIFCGKDDLPDTKDVGDWLVYVKPNTYTFFDDPLLAVFSNGLYDLNGSVPSPDEICAAAAGTMVSLKTIPADILEKTFGTSSIEEICDNCSYPFDGHSNSTWFGCDKNKVLEYIGLFGEEV